LWRCYKKIACVPALMLTCHLAVCSSIGFADNDINIS
jgi:hypothetical protein